jgi:hypothetical protein
MWFEAQSTTIALALVWNFKFPSFLSSHTFIADFMKSIISRVNLFKFHMHSLSKILSPFFCDVWTLEISFWNYAGCRINVYSCSQFFYEPPKADNLKPSRKFSFLLRSIKANKFFHLIDSSAILWSAFFWPIDILSIYVLLCGKCFLLFEVSLFSFIENLRK